MYGIAPISGIIRKASRIRTHEDLKSRSFLSHRAFMKKPHARKNTHAKKSGTKACISLRYSPKRIGRTVNRPEICSKKPKFARMCLLMPILRCF